jgi:hypothetical protein
MVCQREFPACNTTEVGFDTSEVFLEVQGCIIHRRGNFMRSLLVIMVCAAAVPAADPAAVDVAGVNKAIEKGKDALLRLEAGKGNWEGIGTTGKLISYAADQNGGVTALATLALLTSGLTPDHKAVAAALDYIRSLPNKRTYVVGLTTMALAEAKQPRDLVRIEQNVTWFFENATYRGGKLAGWGYPHEGRMFVDGSNTQYALLGLYAAKQAGVKIPDEKWNAIRDLYLAAQKEEGPTSGYWKYDLAQNSGHYTASYSMTVAGVCGLLIAGMGLNDSKQQLNDTTGVAARCGEYDTNGPIMKGMNWIAARFTLTEGQSKKMSVLYNVYGTERLGRLSGQRWIGKADWYREGCKELLKTQNPDGTWTRNDPGFVADHEPAIATSFGLLFLCKGRTPLIISKFAHGDASVKANGTLVERGDSASIVNWNRKQSDVRNLAEFASRELFGGATLGWQVYDSRKANLSAASVKSEVEGLLACPIVYFTGHGPLVLSTQQKEILKKYVDEGGFLLAEACCGDQEFATSFHKLMRELFPENALTRMAPAHPIWQAYYKVSPADFPFVDSLERGCKTVVVFTMTPVSGFWEEARFQPAKGVTAANQGQRAYQFGANVIAYATGMQLPEQRGTKHLIADSNREQSPPRGAFKPAQLKMTNEAAPAPAAMRNLLTHVIATANIDAAPDKIDIAAFNQELAKYKFVYLHGRRRVELSDAEMENLKMHLETDGTLFADAACGKPEFDESFRTLMTKMFPTAKLEPIPPSDEMFGERINGTGNALRTVKRREKAGGTGPEGGYKELPPALEGIKIDGRWAVIYSKWDVGCALEKHNSTECLGHTPESALKIGMAAVLYSLKR